LIGKRMHERVLHLGVIGLGRAFTLMLPTFVADRRIRLVAGAEPRPEARALFEREFGRAYDSAEALCAEPAIDAIYVASPHQMHAAHVRMAAQAGKHVLVEKPIAITLAECQEMITAAAAAKVHLIVGHSHSFDAPIARVCEIVESGALGDVRMICAVNYTDFLYRPRRPEELVTDKGGGVIFSQGAHQIDIVRLIGGGRVKTINACTGAWDLTRPTEGAYSVLLEFEGGSFASATYNGYGRFDSDEFTGWVSETGRAKDATHYGAARRALAATGNADAERMLKNARNFGGPKYALTPSNVGLQHEHFGFLMVSCDRADLRPLPTGVMIYGDDGARLDPLPPPVVPRSEVIDELYDAVVHGCSPLHDGAWAMATLEACLAIISSARSGTPVSMNHQVSSMFSKRRRSRTPVSQYRS
jgi:phthalate 4,5-cis-dihydrodiol dehydrogenase